MSSKSTSLISFSDAADLDATGPGRDEAWWWLGIPVATAVGIVLTWVLAPDFYRNHMLPEGYGLLEISHFLLPFAGFIICLKLLFQPAVKADRLLRFAIAIFAVCCIYIAGEEYSWGQWLFYWDTPERWAAINRQQETNLHNTHYLFNQLPQTLLYSAILIGGIALPLWGGARRALSNAIPVLGVLIPPRAVLGVAVVAALFKQLDRAQKDGVVPDLLERPSEATETFFYMFVLFYLIMLQKRISILAARSM